jgi:cellobiose epimerase
VKCTAHRLHFDIAKGETMNGKLIKEFTEALEEGILKRWYPLVLDKEWGGYFSNVTCDWEIPVEQEKMIVTQARHIWTLSKVADFFRHPEYESMALHGFRFLRDSMWDHRFGGFFQIRSRTGEISDVNGWRDEKRTYGNAFGVYGLAALYKQTKNTDVLDFAQRAFQWIEDHSFDTSRGGYFQFIAPDGRPFDSASSYKTIASDVNELGFKDQNSSIHLIEAYTELYGVWKDPVVKKQLHGLLTLIRDTMVTPEGYLRLFFHPDWTPVSFRDSSDEERQRNFGLDHVSFGHDYETAFLMLEASYALGIEGDHTTLNVAKKMLDHALRYGFDESVGGFYDAGYYFKGEQKCKIIKNTKNWWAQAEGLNALLLFSKIFPGEQKYYDYFLRQWNYVRTYIIDPVNGDWFEGGLDKEPHFKNGPRGHIWKGTYHTARALMNCIALLKEDGSEKISSTAGNDEGIQAVGEHWKRIAAARPQKN